MGLLLTLATLYVPQPLRKRNLEMLFRATAEAFRTEAPATRGLSCDECLARYARFTREQADDTLRRGREPEVKARLFQSAHSIGQQFRADLKVDTGDVMRAATLLYRMLGIDFRGRPGGDIVIRRCYFSTYYTSAVCRLMSSLDEGLLVGLAGGGRLSFSERITEGNEYCLAQLRTEGNPG